MGPSILSIQAEADPAMASLRQLHMTFGRRWHFCGVKDKQLLTCLVADPKFRLIRCQTRAVGTVGDFFFPCEYAVEGLTGLEVYDIESHMVAKTDIADPVLAIHCVRENTAF